MKKLLVIGLVLTIGLSMAFASSLKVPWYVDTAPEDTTNPPASGVLGFVYLTSNLEGVITCAITYFSQEGDELGPDAPDNTFTIAPKSTLAFRPVADGGSQEAGQGVDVPNLPNANYPVGDNPTGNKPNGSILIEWEGGDTDVQGQTTYIKGGGAGVVSTAHLLPPGV